MNGQELKILELSNGGRDGLEFVAGESEMVEGLEVSNCGRDVPQLISAQVEELETVILLFKILIIVKFRHFRQNSAH